jgi:hypothetical protein
MRALVLFTALVVGGVFAFLVGTNTIFRPPPAADRLAGVHVRVASYSIESLAEAGHRLHLQVVVTSTRNLDDCLGFTLDEPFAGRRVEAIGGTCVQPQLRPQQVTLIYDHLSNDDLAFPSHTLVWGIPGGRCGVVLELFGVCVVEQAGTADFDLPSHGPSFPPFGSFGPLFPEPSFAFDLH